jgi:hypothetical protein
MKGLAYMTDSQQTPNIKINDHELWRHLEAKFAKEITLPDPEIVSTIQKFYPDKEGLIK